MSPLNLPTKYASAVAALLAIGIYPNAAIAQSLPAQSPSAFPAAPLPPAEPWQPVEQVKTYAIRGATGIDLYRSIGEHGPAAGVPAIAHTSFKLTWTRDYRPHPDGSCVLAVAKPKLIITYTLPKAPSGLPPVVAEKWQRFVSGVETHERVHGEQIVDMVRGIEAFSRGRRSEMPEGASKTARAAEGVL